MFMELSRMKLSKSHVAKEMLGIVDGLVTDAVTGAKAFPLDMLPVLQTIVDHMGTIVGQTAPTTMRTRERWTEPETPS